MFTQPCFSCGILYLVSQIITKKKSIQALILKSTTIDSLEEDDDERYSDVKDEIQTHIIDEEDIKQDTDIEVKDVNDSEVLYYILCSIKLLNLN